MDAFAHADDAAGAEADAGCVDVIQRFEAFFVCAGRDDFVVELRAGVEVVVVGGEAGLAEALGLVFGEHAEGAAGFHSEGAYAAHHFQDAVELAGLLGRIAPGRAHAEAR